MYECVGVGNGVYLTCFSVPVCLFVLFFVFFPVNLVQNMNEFMYVKICLNLT